MVTGTGGASVETHWMFSWRLALDVSRFDAQPIPVTTYEDPYGESGVTFTPRMYNYAWESHLTRKRSVKNLDQSHGHQGHYRDLA